MRWLERLNNLLGWFAYDWIWERLLAWAESDEPTRYGGQTIYRVNLRMRVHGIGYIAASLLTCWPIVLMGEGFWGVVLWVLPIGFFVAGFWILSTKIILDTVTITKKNLFYSKTLRWFDINTILYYEDMPGLEFQTRDGNKSLTVEHYYVGMLALLEEAAKTSGITPDRMYT